MTAAFAPWQQRAFDQTVAALDAGRLGHGLLICGPEGLGKRAVALALAEHVLASSPDPALAQRTRQLIAAGTHPDLQLVSFIHNRTGDKLRTEIVIEQVREISQKLALTPHDGIAQVVIVDPADAINRSACNALLKTLEEPSPGRYLWLISAQPARLPATIRSRCQRLEFKLPPAHEALAWLLSQGVSERAAQEALDAARAIPAWRRSGCAKTAWPCGVRLRRIWSRLASGRAGAVDVAQRWTNDGQADQRLRHAADLALAQASPA
ncbi:DNA polymerase III subunit delta' [Xanthomonas oryzae]|uniref:DNA polymerase III subunit delta' n=1 Tax=Xanthomonas oryzae TaxID=347 RepID=UPI001F5E4A70|nr:DNA polymerase III subunit delta' [Xanthomonas oryzae]